MGARFRPRRRPLHWWAFSLVLWYTIFGFFILPRLLRAGLLWQLPKQLGREATVTKLKVNPYTFRVAIEGLTINEPTGKPFIAWEHVAADLEVVPLLSGILELRDVAISNAYVHVQVNRDGTLNFTDLIRKFAPAAPASPPPQDARPLIVRVGSLRIIGSSVSYEDFSRTTPFHSMIGPITVSLQDFSTSPDNKNPYGFIAVTESGEKFSWSGQFFLAPIRSSGEVTLENISLKKYAPYYEDRVNLAVNGGLLDVSTTYRVELTDHLTVAQLSNATVSVRSLQVAEKHAATNTIEIADLKVAGTDLDVLAQTARIGSVESAGGRIAVAKRADGSLNLAQLFAMPPSPASTNAPATASTNTPAWTATVRDINLREYGITVTGFLGEQELGWQSLQITNVQYQMEPMTVAVGAVIVREPNVHCLIPEGLTNAFAVSTSSTNEAPAARSTTARALPPISVGSITVTNGSVAYTDNSLKPPAALTVSRLDVDIAGLSSDPSTRADITVAGRVDHTAPIEITGQFNPLNIDAQTDVHVMFKGVDLVPVGPYSGHYLGYGLRKGALSLDVKYTIDQRKLTAQNLIIVDRLTFGDKTDSPVATKAPVKLVVAILKDRNGKIELNVPVEGRIDDPQFRYGRALINVLGKLFTKIITAPFAMLGSMFGGGDQDISFVAFAPGSTELTPAELKKLDLLIKALTERPGLQLEIQGSVDAENDGEPLKRQKLLMMLRTMKLRAEQPQAALAAPLPELSPDEHTKYLRLAYVEALPKIQELAAAKGTPVPGATEPAKPDLFTNIRNLVPFLRKADEGKEAAAKTLRPAQAKKLAAELPVAELERQYLEVVELSPDNFRQLATQRAGRVVSYLQDHGKLGPERITQPETAGQPPLTKGAQVLFGLE